MSKLNDLFLEAREHADKDGNYQVMGTTYNKNEDTYAYNDYDPAEYEQGVTP